ncbi:hypothetical protein P7K49_026044, partial [Saguinus oedipus]
LNLYHAVDTSSTGSKKRLISDATTTGEVCTHHHQPLIHGGFQAPTQPAVELGCGVLQLRTSNADTPLSPPLTCGGKDELTSPVLRAPQSPGQADFQSTPSRLPPSHKPPQLTGQCQCFAEGPTRIFSFIFSFREMKSSRVHVELRAAQAKTSLVLDGSAQPRPQVPVGSAESSPGRNELGAGRQCPASSPGPRGQC